VLLWRYAGICREAKGLEKAITQIQQWRLEFNSLGLTQTIAALSPGESVRLPSHEAEKLLRRWAETQNLLDNADLILKSALFRTESRGGHYRLDYPATDPNWQVHTVVTGSDWSRSAPVEGWTQA
jgi:L-aspartate oxidase